MDDEFVLDISKSEFDNLALKLPGKSKGEKLIAGAALSAYIAARCELDRKTFLDLSSHIFDQLIRKEHLIKENRRNATQNPDKAEKADFPARSPPPPSNRRQHRRAPDAWRVVQHGGGR
jgi:hypothetical protein